MIKVNLICNIDIKLLGDISWPKVDQEGTANDKTRISMELTRSGVVGVFNKINISLLSWKHIIFDFIKTNLYELD